MPEKSSDVTEKTTSTIIIASSKPNKRKKVILQTAQAVAIGDIERVPI